MQDNEWKDDKGFYDEAWKDMSARLDAAPKPRSRVLWPWALLLPILILAVWVALSGNGPNVEPTSVDGEAVSARAGQNAVSNSGGEQSEFAATVLKATSSEEKATVDVRSSAQLRSKTGNEGFRDAQLARTTDAFGSILNDTANSTTVVRSRQLSSELPGGSSSQSGLADGRRANRGDGGNNSQNEIRPTEELDQSEVATAGTAASPTDALPETATIRPPRQSSLPYLMRLETYPVSGQTSLDLSPPSPGRRRRAPQNSFFLEAATTASSDFNRLGFTVGAGYALNAGRRWSFPVSLSYRLDRDNINLLRLSPAVQLDVSAPLPPIVDYADLSLGQLQRNGSDLTSTSGLELSLGAAFRVSPRLSFGARAGLFRRLTFTTPRITDESGTNLIDVSFEEGNFNNSSTNEVAFTDPGGLLVSRDISPTTTSVRPWALSTTLDLDYRVSSRFVTVLSSRYLPASPTSDDIIEISPVRLSLGLRYYLR